MAVEETAEHKMTEVWLSSLEDSTYKGSSVGSKWDTKSKNGCYSYNQACNSNQSYLSTSTKLIVIVLAVKKKNLNSLVKTGMKNVGPWSCKV